MNPTPVGPSVTRVVMIRHGEVENHDRGIYNGQLDVDITPKGVRDMERAAAFLAGAEVRHIYSSDLRRTVRGAAIIAGRLGLDGEGTQVPQLREIHLGEWQGLSAEEVDARYPGMREARLADIVNARPPGGETVADLSGRVVPAVLEIVERHRGETVAVVAHAGTNRMVLCHALGVPLERVFSIEQDYGAINVIDFHPDRTVVRLVNG
ncbi:MAG: histidine phosphatase family protein [Nitrospinota bacterium]